MAVTLATFVPLISLYVPKCPTILMQDEVLKAAQTFCEETQVWELTSDTTYTSGEAFEITLPDYSDLITVKDAWLNTVPLKSGRDYQVSTIEDEIAIDIRTAKMAGDILKLVLILKPKDGAPSLPVFLWREYRDAIKYRALSDIMKIPGQPWTNLGMSAHYEGKYGEARGKALLKLIRRGTNAPLEVFPRVFGL